MDDRVREWMRRKETHAHDPLEKCRDGSQVSTAQTTSYPMTFVATFNGREIANTSRPQIVNRRVYFPFEDIRQQYLVSSSKRWR